MSSLPSYRGSSKPAAVEQVGDELAGDVDRALTVPGAAEGRQTPTDLLELQAAPIPEHGRRQTRGGWTEVAGGALGQQARPDGGLAGGGLDGVRARVMRIRQAKSMLPLVGAKGAWTSQ